MNFIGLILSGSLIASDINTQFKDAILNLQKDGIITPEEGTKIESGGKIDWNKDNSNPAGKKVWILSCIYAKCYNKFNKDDICKGGGLELFSSPKNEKIVFSSNGKYSLSVFNSNQIIFGRTSKEAYSPYMNESIFSLTKEMIVFNRKTKLITKTIHKSVYRDEGLLDKKVYGDDSYIVYEGKCNFRGNAGEKTLVLPP